MRSGPVHSWDSLNIIGLGFNIRIIKTFIEKIDKQKVVSDSLKDFGKRFF